MVAYLIAGRVLFIGLLVIVTYLTVAPNPETAEPGFLATRIIASFLFGDAAYADKVGHFVAYGALGAAARFSLRPGVQWWPVALGLAAYGMSLEGVQYFLDARSAEIWDALANALGAVAGIGGGALFLKMLPNKQPIRR